MRIRRSIGEVGVEGHVEQAEGVVSAWKGAGNWKDSRWSCPRAFVHGEGYIFRSRKRIQESHSFSEAGPLVAWKLLISRILRIRHPKKD